MNGLIMGLGCVAVVASVVANSYRVCPLVVENQILLMRGGSCMGSSNEVTGRRR